MVAPYVTSTSSVVRPGVRSENESVLHEFRLEGETTHEIVPSVGAYCSAEYARKLSNRAASPNDVSPIGPAKRTLSVCVPRKSETSMLWSG